MNLQTFMRDRTWPMLDESLLEDHTKAEVTYMRYALINESGLTEEMRKTLDEKKATQLEVIMHLRETMGAIGLPYRIAVHADGLFSRGMQSFSVNGADVSTAFDVICYFTAHVDIPHTVIMADGSQHTGHVSPGEGCFVVHKADGSSEELAVADIVMISRNLDDA